LVVELAELPGLPVTGPFPTRHPLYIGLVANFGPDAPAPGSVTLPGGAGKELVETRCAVCHSLERVTAVKRPARDWDMIVANMYERWGVSATDKAQAITSYLAAQFGRN
jgi:mono/diheme cytochrome c family protein